MMVEMMTAVFADLFSSQSFLFYCYGDNNRERNESGMLIKKCNFG